MHRLSQPDTIAPLPLNSRTIPRGQNSRHLGLCSALLLTLALPVAADPLLQGVDVSSYNGVVDWNQVAASGRTFAFARVSDGLNVVDSTFATNYAGIHAAGMVRGAYQFFEPGQDPVAQANLLLAEIGPLSAGDLTPVLDVEVTAGKSSSVLAGEIQAWVSTIESSTGEAPIIYTGKNFWNTSVASSHFSDDPLWIAAWGVSHPLDPIGWSDWQFWQYSDSGSVPGIGNTVDLDQFNGSTDALDLLAHLPSTPAPVPEAADSWALVALPCAGIAGLHASRRRRICPA